LHSQFLSNAAIAAAALREGTVTKGRGDRLFTAVELSFPYCDLALAGFKSRWRRPCRRFFFAYAVGFARVAGSLSAIRGVQIRG